MLQCRIGSAGWVIFMHSIKSLIVSAAAHLAAAMFVAASLAACEQFSKQENIYSTYTEASASGALAYGLLPKFMPASAQQIQEMHGRTSNDLLVTFAYAPADHASIVAKCQAIDAKALVYPRHFTEWWPEDLRSAAYQASGYDYYRCADEGGLLAVKAAQSIVYFWRI